VSELGAIVPSDARAQHKRGSACFVVSNDEQGRPCVALFSAAEGVTWVVVDASTLAAVRVLAWVLWGDAAPREDIELLYRTPAQLAPSLLPVRGVELDELIEDSAFARWCERGGVDDGDDNEGSEAA